MEKSVKDLLLEVKNHVIPLIDLAYVAVLLGDQSLAERIIRTRDYLVNLHLELSYNAILGGRFISDARKMVGLIELSRALLDIADACADLAKCAKEGVRPYNIEEFLEAGEIILDAIKIEPNSNLAEKKISDLEKMGIYADIIAIKRNGQILVYPKPEEVLHAHDIVILRGRSDVLRKLLRILGKKMPTRKAVDSEFLARLIEYKEKVQLNLELALSAILLDDEELAESVLEEEDTIDQLHSKLQDYVLKSILTKIREIETHKMKLPEFSLRGYILGLLRLISVNERIADAAWRIAKLVINDYTPPEDLIRAIMESGEEFLRVFKLKSKSKLVGMQIKDLEEKFGVRIVALKRKDTWIHDPHPVEKLQPGDEIIVHGYIEALDDIKRII